MFDVNPVRTDGLKSVRNSPVKGVIPNTPLFHRISSESKPLTRELAQQYQSMDASPTERESG